SGIKVGADEVSKQVEDLSKLIKWEESGWPDWELYRPVFYNTIDSQLPIIAANLDAKIIRKVIKQGSNVLDETYQELLKKYQYDAVLKKELEKEILASHCDMLPEKMLSPMLMGQQVRDLAMTRAIQTARARNKKSDKLILIAGAGHTRTDYGIPFYLHQETPGIKTLSLSFMEVSKDELHPENYIEAWGENTKELPFDYVWFTERAEREDQCEKMRAYMDKKKNKK
ncbi:MAG: ChaN family lipoprotein, partial [Gammaproteobacteria bacterium]|nr:ChaN family lipoprotein [Gammaproteobacteria bacterium]